MKERLHIPPGQWRGPRGDVFDAPPPGGSGFGIAHAVFPWLFLLLFAALVAIAILALIRLWKRTAPESPANSAGAAGRASADQAIQELRLRYARGEIDREEYLQRSADLGEGRPAPAPPAG